MRSALRSPLGKLQPTKLDVEKIKRTGWADHGILVVNLTDSRLSWIDREFVEQLGNKLYGAKRNDQRR